MNKNDKKLDFCTFYSSKYLIIRNLQLLHRKVSLRYTFMEKQLG